MKASYFISHIKRATVTSRRLKEGMAMCYLDEAHNEGTVEKSACEVFFFLGGKKVLQ